MDAVGRMDYEVGVASVSGPVGGGSGGVHL